MINRLPTCCTNCVRIEIEALGFSVRQYMISKDSFNPLWGSDPRAGH